MISAVAAMAGAVMYVVVCAEVCTMVEVPCTMMYAVVCYVLCAVVHVVVRAWTNVNRLCVQ